MEAQFQLRSEEDQFYSAKDHSEDSDQSKIAGKVRIGEAKKSDEESLCSN